LSASDLEQEQRHDPEPELKMNWRFLEFGPDGTGQECDPCWSSLLSLSQLSTTCEGQTSRFTSQAATSTSIENCALQALTNFLESHSQLSTPSALGDVGISLLNPQKHRCCENTLGQ